MKLTSRSTKSSVKVFYKNGIPVPIHVIRERRSNSRISLLKGKINIRLPRGLDQEKSKKQVLDFLKWAQKKIDKEAYYDNLSIDIGKYNRIYTILDNKYPIQLVKWSNNSFKVTGNADLLYVVIPERFLTPSVFSPAVLKRKATNVLFRSFEKSFRKEVAGLHDFALPLIGRSMTDLKFSYTSSKWGSCHSNGQIRLSSRLIYAPEFVRRYVILHELAHLKHMDHSDRFWSLVEQMCPDFNRAKAYLKKHEGSIDF